MKKALMMALVAASIASPALANNTAAGKAHMMADHYFSKIDTNGDGMITKEESQAYNDKMFQEADTNNDGKISKDEMTAMKEKEHAKMTSMHKSMSGKNEKSDMEVDKADDTNNNADKTDDQ